MLTRKARGEGNKRVTWQRWSCCGARNLWNVREPGILALLQLPETQQVSTRPIEPRDHGTRDPGIVHVMPTQKPAA